MMTGISEVNDAQGPSGAAGDPKDDPKSDARPADAPAAADVSQDAEEQIKIVTEMCRFVDKIVNNVGPAEIDVMPPQAKALVKAMKSKMIMYVSTPTAVEQKKSSSTGEVQSSPGDTETESCSDSSDSETVQLLRAKQPLGKSKPTKDTVTERLRGVSESIDDRLLRALERLDTRTVPLPEPFDATTGESLAQFFVKFEEYCAHTFRSGAASWVPELSRFLVGEIHQAFLAHRAPSDSFAEVKRKLLRWYADSKERRDCGSKALFSRAQMRSGESVRLYAPRLENLYRQAYPRKNFETSVTLREKFLATIPRKFRRQVKSAMGLSKTLGRVRMTWTQIVTFVGGFEEALTTDESEAEGSSLAWTVSCQPRGRRTAVLTDACTQSVGNNCGEVDRGDEDYQYQRALEYRPSARGGASSGARSLTSVFMGDFLPGDVAQAALRKCSYCNRLGHVRGECRRLLGLCLVCGSEHHRVASCPNRKTMRGRSDGAPLTGANALPKRVRWSDTGPVESFLDRRPKSTSGEPLPDRSVRPRRSVASEPPVWSGDDNPTSFPESDSRPGAAGFSAHHDSRPGEAALNPAAPEWRWSLRR